MSEGDDRFFVEALQNAYVRALDRKAMLDWVQCFDEKLGAYECVTADNVESGLPLALMCDDCPERLRDRVSFINDVWAGTFTDYATRHFLQGLELQSAGEGRYRALTNFLVTFTTPDRQSGILVAGVYQDEISVSSNKARFLKRRAVLDTTTTPRYLVYPV